MSRALTDTSRSRARALPFPPNLDHLLYPGPRLLPATSAWGKRGFRRSAKGRFLNSKNAHSPQKKCQKGIRFQLPRASRTSSPQLGLPGAPQRPFPTCASAAGAARSPLLRAESHTHLERSLQQSEAGKVAPKPKDRGAVGRSGRGCGAARRLAGEQRVPAALGAAELAASLRDLGAAPQCAGGQTPQALYHPQHSSLLVLIPSFFQHPFLILLLSLLPLLPLLCLLLSVLPLMRGEGRGKGKVPSL